MKSLGFLTVLAAIIAVSSAQNQIFASASSNGEAIAGAASKGTRVIHVPAGSNIHHIKPQVVRPAPNKPTQAAAGARAVATAQAGPAKHGPVHPHHVTPHPQPQHPAHNQKHANAPQKQAVATTTPTAVTKAPKKVDDKKPVEPLDLLKDLPSELKTLVDAVIAEGPLIKAGAGIITGLIDTEKNTVPTIIAGINKGIKDLADLFLSPESVSKAVDTIAKIPDEVAKQVAATLGELVVTHADLIKNLLKALVDVGQLAQTAAAGLSVVATLGVILHNEVFSKIPTDISKLPLDNLPIPLDKLPIPLDKLPTSLDKLPKTLSELLSPWDKLLEPLEKEWGKKLAGFAGAGSQDAAKVGQGVEAPAQVSPPAQATAGGAVAQAGIAAAAVLEDEIPDDSEYGYEDEEEASAEAAASAGPVAVAHAG